MIGKDCKFSLKELSMYQLKEMMDKINPTRSAGLDMISMRTIKNNRLILEPLILNLLNLTITTGVFPTNLTTSKILPILKKTKPRTKPGSYRPINLLPSMSKIMERAYSEQVNWYLSENKLIPAQHHGGIKHHSTSTATLTLTDHWAAQLEANQSNAIVAIDQSAAYDIVEHKLLLKKLQILGFNSGAIKLFKSYLNNRQHVVMVDGSISEKLHTGGVSVVQGSIMSCLLFLLFTLDLPLLLHNHNHNPEQELNCSQPSVSTYVDDWVVTIREIMNRSLQDGINYTMLKLQDYMAANMLVMNTDKTLLMIISKNTNKKNQTIIPNTNPELVVKHSPSMKILGTTVSSNLKWNDNINDAKISIIPDLKRRLTMLRILAKNAPPKILTNIANGIFHSKLLFGMEVWGPAPQYLLSKIQTLQLEACRIVNGPKSQRWTATRLLKSLGWISVKDLITWTSAKFTHKILMGAGPAVLTSLMIQTQYTRNTRQTGPGKLGAAPHSLGRTTTTKKHL
jgi:hypothetical protein